MESMGIIEKVVDPTEWCAPMVPVIKKNGNIRICVDLKRLNENVKREKFILPTLDDLLPKLAKSTVFSSLDAESGFWQIPLEEYSARLTTFITPLGRYCFKRLPFGITSAPEIFQQKMSEMLHGHDGTVVYMDDILVFGETQVRHDQKDKTGMDGELQCVLRYIRNGWPEYLKSIPLNVSAYFKERGSLSETNGLVLRGRQIVIPESLRGDMLQRIHQGHQGLTKCRERYRGAVWWPGIASDVKRLVSSCKHCNIHKPSQNKEPLITTPLPDLPWQKLAADLCEFKSRHYLIVIDYFSRWLEILELPKTTSDTDIQKLKGIFTRFGIPEQLMTDNGPQFSAEQFRHFAAEYDFHHVTSSPHFPQANGMAERAVRTAKWILKQDDPHQALLSYRSTRTEPTKESPARLLMGREIRTTLPVLKESLQPMWPDLEKVKTNDVKAKQCYEKYYNRKYSTKPLPPLSIGDRVRLKIDGEKAWTTTATVQRQEVTPRSFTLG
ncbi:hypothetical protein H4Q32_027367 [Labeo rohita]|uniref:Gypsy retrotransposon integrase-like protein 1 n=1 Tax=Labeo rohita TaxID=84645 RepID=A0ABQ8L9N5_LABRO|nr:hypothetical protein H4Q32_027367 [Labeo rohita]